MMIPEETAVILIDPQERLIPAMQDPDRLMEAWIRLLAGAQVLGLPVVVTEHVPQKLGPVHSALLPRLPADTLPIVKSRFSCCAEPAFPARVEALGRRTLLVCGIEAHVCVYQTALDLLAGGYGVEIAADAVSSRAAANRDVALRRMEHAGGRVTSVEMALFELVRKEDTVRIRTMLKTLK